MSAFTERLREFDEQWKAPARIGGVSPDGGFIINALPAIVEALEAADIGHDGGSFCFLPSGHRDACVLCERLRALDALVEEKP